LSRKMARSQSIDKPADKSEHARRAAVSAPAASTEHATTSEPPGARGGMSFRARLATILTVIGLLTLHYALAARSLLAENPTVDEVVHMPAGITYWQKGTFRLYRHNPPLVKLVAALPVVWANPVTKPVYEQRSWTSLDPDQANFAHTFAYFNADRYFELFQLARLPMPLFSIVGGLAVFAWSRRLYGTLGGLLSLTLWAFCPNILAHARLITSDLGSTALGVAATYVFWRYLHQPGWRWAAAAGFMLGLAQLTKFTMLLLYAVWPFLWLVHLVFVIPKAARASQMPRSFGQGLVIVVLSVVTLDAGYFFEGVGIPLGKFEFGSKTLTRPVAPGIKRPLHSKNQLLEAVWQFRINRLRGTWLGKFPCPLPEHYVLGFDEQKIETEGIPLRFFKAISSPDEAERARVIAHEQEIPESSNDEKGAYSVYLNGELKRTGWWYYYLLALIYKVPEGTWLLVILSLASLRFIGRSTREWAEEITLWTVPVVILFSMSVLTDINLGLRYVLAILPYIFISTGKLIPWTLGLSGARKWVTTVLIAGALGSTITASVWIYPDYLAYFNWMSGGPDEKPARLIDSNLDWGQDLVALQEWWKETIPGKRIGLAYFGQINPSIFKLRGEAFDWFLPPVKPGTVHPMGQSPSPLLFGPAKQLTPGYYAVSATLLYGLPWRLYDPVSLLEPRAFWGPAWNIPDEHADAFWYFRQFKPIKTIGHSIYVYHLSADDIAGAAPLFMARDRAPK
jgi:Dolichyl-phosphate-mannose-protein mannosyltransferase